MNPSSKGAQIEIEFLYRLRQMGYRRIMTPYVEDFGMDVAVLTSKGLIGIQVKAARVHHKKLDVWLSPSGGRPWSDERHDGKQYYTDRGVTVIAGWFEGIWYLIPLEEFSARQYSFEKTCVWRESWNVVLGMPPHEETASEAEISQLNMLWDKSL